MHPVALPALRCPGCGGDVPIASTASAGPGVPNGPAPPAAIACRGCGRPVPVRDGVLVLDDLPGCGDYPPECYDVVAPVEDVHWWHASRNAVIARALGPELNRRALQTALEVGCGTGFVLARLERLGLACIGLDMQAEGLRHARRRVSAPLVRSGRPALPFRESFDLVALCDVLEHADEAPLLAACRDRLRPGRHGARGTEAPGLLLVTVPALPALWSLEDELSGHRRRYTRTTLRAALQAAGLRPVVVRPFHAALVPLAFWHRHLRGRPAGPRPAPAEFFRAALRPPSPRVSRLMRAVLGFENALGAWMPLPTGSSLLALAEPA